MCVPRQGDYASTEYAPLGGVCGHPLDAGVRVVGIRADKLGTTDVPASRGRVRGRCIGTRKLSPSESSRRVTVLELDLAGCV